MKEMQNQNEEKQHQQQALAELVKKMEVFQNVKEKDLAKNPQFLELTKEHKFWNTQPVIEPGKEIHVQQGNLVDKKQKEELQEKIKLPEGFYWRDIDLSNETDLEIIYKHLYDNYVEDVDGCFWFNYSKEFLQWALLHPGFKKELIFGVFNKESQIIGFISGIVLNVLLEGRITACTEVNFLCVSKEFRKHYLASSLIKEVVRRSNLLGVWQGIYTSGTLLPTPFSQTRYFHRSINYKKLVEIKFVSEPEPSKFHLHEKLCSLPNDIEIPEGYWIWFAEEKDVNQIRKLLLEYLKKYQVYVDFSKKEAFHWFVRRENILESFVIEKNNKITDFFSFYCLPSTILQNVNYKELKSAYGYYYVSNDFSMKQLMLFSLIKAKQMNYDVFNCLNIMDNEQAFESLNFQKGCGFLNYYLYNWKLKETYLQPKQIGMILM